MFVNEEGNTVAERGVNVAVTYIKKNNKLGVSVELAKVTGNRSDTNGILSSRKKNNRKIFKIIITPFPVCTTYDNMLATSKTPHLVLDTTMTGLASETVKSFTASLALPTISGSFGQEGDLRQWRNIDDNEKEYLIQISPPADIIPEIVRTLVLNQNISNAAILFDDNFVMDHKYKSLLQNVATRHVIAPIKEPSQVAEQLNQLRNLNIVNFFILGSLANIKIVLDAASSKGYFNRKYAWHAITEDTGDIKCNCKEATIMFAKPMIDAQYQDRLGLIKTSYQLHQEPEIAAAFYFDLALHSFLAIK